MWLVETRDKIHNLRVVTWSVYSQWVGLSSVSSVKSLSSVCFY